MPPDPLSQCAPEFIEAARVHGIATHQAKLAYRAFHRQGQRAEWIAALPALPATPLVDDETVKFTLPLHGGLETESVVIPMLHRGGAFSRTLCLSSQVGCAMGCHFCETGQMGLMRQLTTAEIVQQLHAARFLVPNPFEGNEGFAIKNIVFMGMGEPMDNLEAVLGAIAVMCDGNGPGIASSCISVSTVGRTDGMRRLGEFMQKPGFRRIGLAVSLNAPNDEVRSSIMPINRAEPMALLHEAMLQFPKRPTAAICVEYVLIPGVNDAPEHCDEVCAYLRDIRCSLNVIPYNPRRNSPWGAPAEADVDAFVARAIGNGQFTKRRQTKGRSAMAACGQLGNQNIRARKFIAATTGATDPVTGSA
ncbi:MAG: 23S rRNA (adenine(2503)-C(2))-methyltransferase RlmN [Phycisphaerales bacterium]|nr:23S rRNA (adenine(2503)-C(2))-methyltransferase RlmN [Phycisphaerales bacterium]